VAQVIQRSIAAGAHKFVLRPLCPGEETMEQLAILGREVRPQFQQRRGGSP